MQLLGSLIHFLDLVVTLRVGIPQTDGSFRSLSLPYLAGLAGVELRRAERACHDLVAAGILGVHPIAREKSTGEFSGLPAIRTISQALFRAFNLAQWLRHERDKASKRQRKQERKEEAMGRMELVLKGAAAKARQSNPQSQTAKPQALSKPEEPRSVIARLKHMLRGTGPP